MPRCAPESAVSSGSPIRSRASVISGRRPREEEAMTATTIRVNGIALRCVVEGSGEPLALIHGVGASLEVWDGVAARLRDHYRILRYDQRGHGHSDKTPGPYTVEGFSGD